MCGSTSSLQPLSSIKAPSLQGEIPLSWCRPNTLGIVGLHSLGAHMYWKSIGLAIRLHKHIYIHKAIWIMFGVRWSRALLVLPFVAFLLFLDLYKQYGIIFIPLGPTLWPYSNLNIFPCPFHYIFTNNKQFNALPSTTPPSFAFLLITSNLTLHLQQFRVEVPHKYSSWSCVHVVCLSHSQSMLRCQSTLKAINIKR